MLTLHLLAAIFSFGVIWKADKEALSWVLGKKAVLNAHRLHYFHLLTWFGLGALIVTGTFLSYPMLGYLLSQKLFIMKLLFVVILLLNALLIGRLMEIPTTRAFASVSWKERMPLLLSGATSGISWFGALVLALTVFK